MRCVPPREGCPPARTHQDLSATNAEAKHSLRLYGPVSLRIWGQDRRGLSRTLRPSAAAVHLGHHVTPAQQHRGSGKKPWEDSVDYTQGSHLGGRGAKSRPHDHPETLGPWGSAICQARKTEVDDQKREQRPQTRCPLKAPQVATGATPGGSAMLGDSKLHPVLD